MSLDISTPRVDCWSNPRFAPRGLTDSCLAGTRAERVRAGCVRRAAGAKGGEEAGAAGAREWDRCVGRGSPRGERVAAGEAPRDSRAYSRSGSTGGAGGRGVQARMGYRVRVCARVRAWQAGRGARQKLHGSLGAIEGRHESERSRGVTVDGMVLPACAVAVRTGDGMRGPGAEAERGVSRRGAAAAARRGGRRRRRCGGWGRQQAWGRQGEGVGCRLQAAGTGARLQGRRRQAGPWEAAQQATLAAAKCPWQRRLSAVLACVSNYRQAAR